jgi:hypothetical protein
MSDASVIKGPPKFKPLSKTSVRFNPIVVPSLAAMAEDFSKKVPLVFTGMAPEPLAPLAPLPVQIARLDEIADIAKRSQAVPKNTPKKADTRIDLEDLPKVIGPKVSGPKVSGPKVSEAMVSEAMVPEAMEAEKEKPLVDDPTVNPTLRELIGHVKEKIDVKSDIITPPFFVPENRRAFKAFIIQVFKNYQLPKPSDDPDPETCQKAAKASSKELKTFQYQAFVRDYLQRASPYRGLLVYHGLGSGKTCTSIATAEALYSAGNKKIIIMTPASLSGNFRGEMMKCGFFAFQQENHWTFVPALVKVPGPELTFLLEVLGLPIDWINKIKGGWVPDPKMPSNWKTLEPVAQAQINEQIKRHIDSRFQFINYNGLTEERVRAWACDTPKMFDGAVIIIDEIHNMIRTINGSNLEAFYKQEPLEPDYKASFCQTGKKYRIGYLLYRLLCNAVGAKIIGLSGTPIINYPQELGILANILSGDMRYASFTLPPNVDRGALNLFLNKHPEVDLHEIVAGDGHVSVRMTPVCSGYRKVVTAEGVLRGFIRNEDLATEKAEVRRERDLLSWTARIEDELKKVLKDESPLFSNTKYGVFQRLPDIEEDFVKTFINKDTLSLLEPNNNVLTARLSGLISYYKAGKPELVARVTKDEIVKVEMSDRQLQQYTIVRNAEIKQEEKDSKGKMKAKPAKIGYDDVMKTQKSTFKIFSRASCNYVFPDEIPRPRPGDESYTKTDLGESKDDEEIISDEVQETAVKIEATVDDPYKAAIRTALVSLRQRGTEFFNKDALKIYSPKFQAIIDNMEDAKGPVLVYSNFKTLEGLGIFGIALEFQKNYIRLDIEQVGGKWVLVPELLLDENKDKKRYISYTGDDVAEKRDILKHIFNANWAKLSPELSEQVKKICGGSNDNIKGQIAQAFMITQSGAEGISLENVRQVQLMEPYWNYVRLEQVKGRAIRICSHKSLPYNERTVDVFTYISVFSEKQKSERSVDQTLLIKDGGLSTDEQIFDISNGKKTLAESLFGAMKAGAVDCELNANENGVLACYRFPKPTMDKLFNPKLDDDVRESAAAVRVVKK